MSALHDDDAYELASLAANNNPLMAGDFRAGEPVHAFASREDAYAFEAASGERNGNFIVGEGAKVADVLNRMWEPNGKDADAKKAMQAMLSQLPNSICYCWMRRNMDGFRWQTAIRERTKADKVTIRRVDIPAHNSLTAWVNAGADSDALLDGMLKAKVIEAPVKRSEAAPRSEKPEPPGATPRPTKSGSELQGSAVICPDVEPWPEAVNCAEVLNDVASAIGRYVALPDGAADMIALWCAHAHCFQEFQCSPRLNIYSPEKGCGKTTLRDVVSVFVPRALCLENMTEAVAFRLVEKHAPVLLADEYDGWLKDNEGLRSLLNSGHRRGGMVPRCEGDGNEVRLFRAYAPAVLCGIGPLPGTLHDRSIVVRLTRAKQGEVQARFDSRHIQREKELCRKLARCCADNREKLAIDPKLPGGVFNRLADNWRPLFAIAKAAGGDWPERCAEALGKLTSRDIETESLRVMLLADIQPMVQEAIQNGSECLASIGIIDALLANPERPWNEVNRGKPINERWLARRLDPLNREGSGMMKGRRLAVTKWPKFRTQSNGSYTSPFYVAKRHIRGKTAIPQASQQVSQNVPRKCHKTYDQETLSRGLEV